MGFSVSDDGRVNSWCWDAGNDSHAGRELPEELVQTHAVRLSDGYFLAARLSWKLLGNLRRNGKFGFCIAANDSDSPNQRSVYFLTPDCMTGKMPVSMFRRCSTPESHCSGRLCRKSPLPGN
ncbi:MAG: hypothetical protein L6W00_01515 [Lentisphaeria bacterium]|nr:MAG: hypothetical protein L6W00_01515 [Lentisphaeria bacterium]